MQPFDGGKFDKRYDDVFAPAISAAGLEPYRVDRDPGVTIPIEDIHFGIESSRVCLADISVDNPNVWFELGYAIASRREVVLICSDERLTRFPFDVQHRNIIKYSTESPQDFERLQKHITTRLEAVLKKERQLGALVRMTSTESIEGLEQHEIAALIAVAQELSDPTEGVAAQVIQRDMEKAGFTKIATTLGVRRLLSNDLLETFQYEDYNDTFTAFRVTDAGMDWLFQNTDKINLKVDRPAQLELDDIPF